jgi:putative DNA primase/helicase
MQAAEIAHALKARKSGRGWKARCPSHDDSDPSLSIDVNRDGMVLIHCFAGCSQDQVIAALCDRGLWSTADDRPRPRIVSQPDHHEADDQGRRAAALDIWKASIPASGTLVETYLRSRGIILPVPPALRFHGSLRHATGTEWPAMVALITGPNGAPVAVHRTYLARDGKAKAPIDPPRMTLASLCGGAVRLGETQQGKDLAIAEGIETALSIMQACGFPVWAALSTNGMKKAMLPPDVTAVLLCADNDATGKGQEAANTAAERFRREGRSVRITMPPDVGTDFNDLLRKEGKRHV